MEQEAQKDTDLKDTVNKLDEIIRGNGKTPGLSGRLAIVEQKVESIYKMVWVIFGTVSGYIIIQLFTLLLERNP